MFPTTLSAFLSSTDFISFSGSFNNADNPLPKACFFIAFAIKLFTVFLYNFLGQMQVISSPFACRVIVYDAFSKAWSFAQLHVPLNNGIKNHVVKVFLNLFDNLV